MNADTVLTALITESKLLALAGRRSFERGAAYFDDGAVTDLIDTGKTIKARVEGTYEYEVALWPEHKALGYECTCPVGEDGEFCKHAVAAGLAWLAQQQEPDGAPTGFTGREELQAIREYLQDMDQEALVETLMGQVESDPVLRSRLQMKAARRNSTADMNALKATMRTALAVRGFVDYHGMRRFLAKVYPVVDMLAGLLEDGETAAAQTLSEYALKRGLNAYERTDDSDGGFGGALQQISEIHLQSCRQAGADQAALAKSLFKLQLNDHWGFFHFDDYAPLLGEKGVQIYRRLAEKEWNTVPMRDPGDDDLQGDTDYYNITAIMETLARHDGDLDALIAVKSRDLSQSYDFVEISKLLAEAGRRDEALDWAERGRKAFAIDLDVPLLDFLIAEYHRRKRHDEAVQLAWQHFTRYPNLDAYRRLKDSAAKAKAWKTWREQALARIREDIKKPSTSRSNHWDWRPGGHSLLVEIFLWEDDSDSALQEARAGGCSEPLWLELAAARETEHPEDAIEIYQARIEPLIKLTNNDAYDRATELLNKVQTLMHRTARQAEFDAYMEKLRTQYKQKRNFIKRLDQLMEATT